MGVEKTVIIGLHDRSNLESFADFFEASGFKVVKAKDLDEMKHSVIVYSDVTVGYIMDVNLGNPGSPDPSPCLEIYNAISAYVNDGRAMFAAISGSYDAISNAEEQGIPKEYLLRKPFKLSPLLESLEKITQS